MCPNEAGSPGHIPPDPDGQPPARLVGATRAIAVPRAALSLHLRLPPGRSRRSRDVLARLRPVPAPKRQHRPKARIADLRIERAEPVDRLPRQGDRRSLDGGGRIDFSRTTSFDGDKLTVFVRDGDDGKLYLNTVRDPVETNEFRPRIPNHSGRSRVLRNAAHESTTQVCALVSWSNEGPNDYLAAGWWLHQDEDDPCPERIIFVEGPEIDPVINPPELPVAGAASHLGRGSGIFGYALGSDREELEGGYTYDAYRGEMEVVADFEAGTLSGCLGCTGDLVADRTHLEYRFERSPEQYLPEVEAPLQDYEIHFSPVACNDDGSFEAEYSSAAVSVRLPEREVTGGAASGAGASRPSTTRTAIRG